MMRKDHIGDLRDTHTSIAEAFYIVYTVLDFLVPVSVDNALRYSRACLAERFSAKNGDPPEAGKFWENRFFTGKMDH